MTLQTKPRPSNRKKHRSQFLWVMASVIFLVLVLTLFLGGCSEQLSDDFEIEEPQRYVEKTMINAALTKTLGKKNAAAKLLGWGRNTLTRKIKELKINN